MSFESSLRDRDKPPFRLVDAKRKRSFTEVMVDVIQLALIFVCLRIVMLASGIAIIYIPFVDPFVQRLVAQLKNVAGM